MPQEIIKYVIYIVASIAVVGGGAYFYTTNNSTNNENVGGVSSPENPQVIIINKAEPRKKTVEEIRKEIGSVKDLKPVEY